MRDFVYIREMEQRVADARKCVDRALKLAEKYPERPSLRLSLESHVAYRDRMIEELNKHL